MHGTAERARSPRSPQVETPPDADQGRLDISGVMRVLGRHKWTVLITFALVVGAAILITTQLPSRYTATALVVVDSRDSQLLGFQSITTDAIGGNNAIVDTEVEIAQSPTVLGRAAASLDLGNSPDFAERPPLLDMVKSMFGLSAAPETVAQPHGSFATLSVREQARIVERLSRTVDIGRRGLTNIISISATASSPDGAAAAANALADAYIAEQIEARLSSNERAAAFLRDRVESLAAEITAVEAEIDSFVSAKLSELGSPQARDLLTKLGEESKQRQANGTTLTEIQRALDSQDFVRLAQIAEAQQTGLAARREALAREVSGSAGQAEVAEARLRLAALDAQIKAAAEQRASSLQEEIALSNGRSAAFRRQIESTLSDLQLPKDVTTELFRLQREAETRRTLYDSSLAKLRQVEQQSDFKVPDSRIIASAAPPIRASFPPTGIIIPAALVFGLMFGIALAFLREHIVGGISSIEQFENLAGIPVIAAIPRLPQGEGRPDMAVIDHPFSAFSEAIRRVQLGIDVVLAKGKRRIFVTSALPADGKTTISLALARQMAATGASTLLIDADLRHPSVHRFIGADVGDGLIGFLSQPPGDGGMAVSITSEPTSNVSYVLGAKASSIATDALLISTHFEELMRFASENYDVVIVDTPPVGLVVDATIVARHCDLGVFVARYASTSQQQVRAALRELARTDVPVCGVLNAVERTETYRYGRKYRQYYQAGNA